MLKSSRGSLDNDRREVEGSRKVEGLKEKQVEDKWVKGKSMVGYAFTTCAYDNSTFHSLT